MDSSKEPLRANIELKARLDDVSFAESVCAHIGAADMGVDEQTDTYFTLGRYRLKLRESSRGGNWLIGYSRPDQPGARRSQYRITAAPNPGALKATLVRQWGIKAVVKKRRHLWLWQGRVRIHIDHVEGLGDFLEFEAVLDGSAPTAPPSASPNAAQNGAAPSAADLAAAAAAAAAGPGYDEPAAMLDLIRLQHDFGITTRDLVSESYSGLILQSNSAPAGT